MQYDVISFGSATLDVFVKTEALKVVGKTKEQSAKWKKFLSDEQIKRILSIVSDFGLDFYTEDIEPDYENIGVKI